MMKTDLNSKRGKIRMIDKDLQAVIDKQQRICTWKEGNAVEVFKRDGFPCVRYESGVWYHYNVVEQTWW